MPGSVVCDNCINRTVLKSFPKSLLVVNAAKRRVDFVARIITAVNDCILIKRKMVESRVTSDIKPLLLRLANKPERASAAEVGEVNTPPCLTGKGNAAGNIDLFRGGWNTL